MRWAPAVLLAIASPRRADPTGDPIAEKPVVGVAGVNWELRWQLPQYTKVAGTPEPLSERVSPATTREGGPGGRAGSGRDGIGWWTQGEAVRLHRFASGPELAGGTTPGRRRRGDDGASTWMNWTRRAPWMYRAHAVPTTWDEASLACQSAGDGAHLMTPDSIDELRFALLLLAEAMGIQAPAPGATDRKCNDVYLRGEHFVDRDPSILCDVWVGCRLSDGRSNLTALDAGAGVRARVGADDWSVERRASRAARQQFFRAAGQNGSCAPDEVWAAAGPDAYDWSAPGELPQYTAQKDELKIDAERCVAATFHRGAKGLLDDRPCGFKASYVCRAPDPAGGGGGSGSAAIAVAVVVALLVVAGAAVYGVSRQGHVGAQSPRGACECGLAAAAAGCLGRLGQRRRRRRRSPRARAGAAAPNHEGAAPRFAGIMLAGKAGTFDANIPEYSEMTPDSPSAPNSANGPIPGLPGDGAEDPIYGAPVDDPAYVDAPGAAGRGKAPGAGAVPQDGYRALAPDEELEAARRAAWRAKLAAEPGYVDSDQVAGAGAGVYSDVPQDGYRALAPDEELEAARRAAWRAKLAAEPGYVDSGPVAASGAGIYSYEVLQGRGAGPPGPARSELYPSVEIGGYPAVEIGGYPFVEPAADRGGATASPPGGGAYELGPPRMAPTRPAPAASSIASSSPSTSIAAGSTPATESRRPPVSMYDGFVGVAARRASFEAAAHAPSGASPPNHPGKSSERRSVLLDGFMGVTLCGSDDDGDFDV